MTNKIYTMRLFNQDVNSYKSIYMVENKKGKFAITNHYDPDSKPIEYHDGTGWKKINKKDELTLIPKPEKITCYEDIAALVEKYSPEIAAELLGFDLNSFGNARVFNDFRNFIRFAPNYLPYLNFLAEVDYKIYQLILEKGAQIRINPFAVKKENSRPFDYFNNNPFLGANLNSMIICFPATFLSISAQGITNLDSLYDFLGIDHTDKSYSDMLSDLMGFPIHSSHIMLDI